MAAAGTQRALQQLGQTVNPSPRLPGAALLPAWIQGGLDPNSTFQAHYPTNPIDAIFGQPAPYVPPPPPPPSPASQQQQMLNSIAATNPDLANAIAAKLGISYQAPTHGPTIGPTTFTQSLDPNNPNVAGFNTIPINTTPRAPVGLGVGNPDPYENTAGPSPDQLINYLPPGQPLGTLAAQRRRR